MSSNRSGHEFGNRLRYHEYSGVKIPVMTAKNPNPFYNLPQDEIDKLKTGQVFVDGDCVGDYGTPVEEVLYEYPGDEHIKKLVAIQKANAASLFDVLTFHEVPYKNQNGLGWCWGFAACNVAEAAVLERDGVYEQLSASSVCAPVVKGRDVGGLARYWLEHAEKYGILPTSLYPELERSYRKYDTPELNAERARRRVKEWLKITKGDMRTVRWLLATNNACALGLMWWGHQVAFYALDWSDEFGGWLYLMRNSHRQFGLDGWCWMTESVATHGAGSAVRVA